MEPRISVENRTAKARRLAEREHFEQVLWRRTVLRRGVVLAVAFSAAALVTSLVVFVGGHLTTKWWIESQDGQVVWEFDRANWRQGGTTSVAFTPKNRFWQPQLGNSDLAYLQRLHRVTSLDLAENDRITNKGLAKLRGLDFLIELNLERLDRFRDSRISRSSTPLTDACLVHLQALPRLKVLTLAGNLITDEGLAQIAKIKTLKTLDLEATEITDAGLAHLAEMKNLESVNLGATRVTKAGLTQLQTARPDLKIELEADAVVQENVKQARGTAR